MEEDEKEAGLLANCVDGIKEGLKKITVCQDLKKDEISNPVLQSSRYERPAQKNDILTKEILDSLPALPSSERTIEWIQNLPSPDLSTDSIPSLRDLPMRGTILPTRYTPEAVAVQGSLSSSLQDKGDASSLSQYEDARGTHGRGTPPAVPQGQRRLDSIFLKLAQNLEKEARKRLVATGQQHLLSYNLMDVYRHQVSGLPLGTTPEIVPFMSPSAMTSNEDVRHQVPRVLCPIAHSTSNPTRPLKNTISAPFHYCQWSKCQRCFQSSRELLDHIEKTHIPVCTAGKLACRWNGCDRIFAVRYKLLLHISNAHCREAVILDDRKALLSVKQVSLMKPGRKQLAPISNNNKVRSYW